jgi:glycerophosphoryl diester phosphodiesterase/predicted esterase
VRKETFVYSIKGNDSLRLDKYDLSHVTGQKPCLIFVFGGGFTTGSRDHATYLPFFERLTRNGYAVVAIDYRLGMKDFSKSLNKNQSKLAFFNHFVDAFKNTITAAVEDLFDATGFVVAHAEEWHIHPDRIVSCGSSAGAITVLQGEYEICNQSLLSKRLPQGFNYAGVISFAGAIFSDQGDLKWSNKPAPIQLFHGDMDNEVPYGKLKFRNLGFYGSQYIAAQLDKTGSPYYFYSVENASHEMATTPMNRNWNEISTFLEKLVSNKEKQMIRTSVKATEISGAKKKLKLQDYIARYIVRPQTKIIAHRGFWNQPGSAQNSLSSLKNAIQSGVYGSELDVWITKDGVTVLNHDNSYQGTVIETATFAELSALRLANGEPLPTLAQYIQIAKKQKQTKLIVEIKSHATVENENRAVAATVKQINEGGIADRVDYISFSENICKELIKSNPKHRVAYLSGDKSPEELKGAGYWGLDYQQDVLKKNPAWIKEAKQLGLTTNVWTVNDAGNMQYFISQGIDYITTDNPQLLKELLDEIF